MPTVPSPSAVQACLADLSASLPNDAVRTDDVELNRSSKDLSYHHPQRPHAVVYVSSEQEIAFVLRTCNRHGIPVIAVAGRTSIEGATIPSSLGGIVLDVSQMDKIVAIHADDLDCVVEPGIGWMELREELEPLGLFFPPDPGASACVGGMCGTNCSGTLAWRYGTMKDNVLSLRVVLPNGDVVMTRRRATKSSAGYDLTRLFIGSEGTLGVISQATLRLRRIPAASSVAMIQFPTLDSAALAVQRIITGGISLHRIELMDDHTIRSVNHGRTPSARLKELTTLLIEFAAQSPAAVAEQVSGVKTICMTAASEACGGHLQDNFSFRAAADNDEAEKLWVVRKTAFFASKNLRPDLEGKSRILTTDSAVPISRIRDMFKSAREDLDRFGLTASIVAHVGDGNLHVLIVVDSDNEEEVARAEKFRLRNAQLAVEMDGTCTGEHGVGIGKVGLLEMEVGKEAIDLMRRIKSAVDPKGIMNPGKVLMDPRVKL
ncbi:hypothetical protein HK104_006688 [Borealophlyctis nickersoniae]|nr:hypothetical protein HK104_006688 [Borealophlyctis nickersoniae]